MSVITIQTIGSNLVVDSRLIAAELGIEHRALKQLVRTYQVDFEEFGNLNISNVGVFGTASYETFYYLNEDQSYLVLTFVKNTAEARLAKLNLVKAFKAAREALVESNQSRLPRNYKEALIALVEAEEVKERLTLKNAEQIQQLQEQEEIILDLLPGAEASVVLLGIDKDVDLGTAAKLLAIPGVGRNKLYEILRKGNIIMPYKNEPYQHYIVQGYFSTRESVSPDGRFLSIQTLVTQKGLQWLIKRLETAGYKSSKLAETAA
ncbi:phage antirepressor KilAC domain-containing protein [Nostoc sp. FACHB-973]|nr:phage antirepressor KilAC domain-containing protein [Nostoc sp. FACHB-973]